LPGKYFVFILSEFKGRLNPFSRQGDTGGPFICQGKVYAMFQDGGWCEKGVNSASVFVLVKNISPYFREIMKREG
jgi:hypothetical protein